MQSGHTVLLLSTDETVLSEVDAALGAEPEYRLLRCRTEPEAACRLKEVLVQLIVADADAIADDARNVLVDARIAQPQTARVLLGSAAAAERCGELARRAAAYLYLLKPVFRAQMRLVISRALEMGELSRRHRLLSRELKISIDDHLFTAGGALAVRGAGRSSRSSSMPAPRWPSLAPRRGRRRGPNCRC